MMADSSRVLLADLITRPYPGPVIPDPVVPIYENPVFWVATGLVILSIAAAFVLLTIVRKL